MRTSKSPSSPFTKYGVSQSALGKWVKQYSTHLKQQFSQHSPNLVWVSDFTYIKAGGRWYYLCVIIDLFSRKVIAWHISAKPDMELVMTTFKKAYKARNTPYGLMFHSDGGSQYTAFAFRQLLDSLHVVQSFSKKGYPFDNAVCKSFFRYLKKEKTDRRTYMALTDLKISVFSYKDTIIQNVLIAHLTT